MLFYYKPLGRTIVGLLLLLGFTQQIHAQWSISQLHPAAANNSGLYGGAPGQQVGYITTSGGPTHAGYWSGASGSFVDLDPTGTWLSYANASNGSQQGGSLNANPGSFERHAYLWSGTAASGVDLHPAGSYARSTVTSMTASQQGGTVDVSLGTPHAALWSGTAASFIDLHLVNQSVHYISTEITAMAGSQQAGFGRVSGGSQRALLWNGSATDYVYLHSGPTSTLSASAVYAMTTTQQGGMVVEGIKRATIWSGHYSSRVDLHPTGAASSQILAMVDGYQAGEVNEQAAVWEGSPESYVNLHALVVSNLSSDYTKSKVTGAYIENDTLFLVGSAINTVNPSEVAVIWSMPLPALPPEITTQPISQHVAHLSNPVFTVEASGTGGLSYQWQENNYASDYAWVDISEDNFRYEGEDETSLTVLNTLHVTQNTQFRCVVSDEKGSVTSDAATITYFYTAPTITQQPLSQTILEGTTLELVVSAQSVGSVLLPYQWKKNGQNISAATESTYSIPSAGLSDQGDYQAVATNSIGSTISETATVRVLAPKQIVSMAAGYYSGTFLRSDGTLWGVGNRSWFGSTVGSDQYPVYLTEDVIKADAETTRTVFLKSDGTLWYVGRYLVENSEQKHQQPVQIASGVIDVSLGSDTVYFIKEDRTLWGVGSNAYGQLADGSTNYRSSPVQIATGVKKVAGGFHRLYFIKTDRTLWAIGLNQSGALGDGTEVSRSEPVQVASSVSAVFSGGATDIALYLTNDGTLWGMGALGLLLPDQPDFSNPPEPTPIQLATGVVDAAVGSAHILYIKEDRTLWGRGRNAYGELGDGTFTHRRLPVQIASELSSVDAGGDHSFFLKQDGTLWAMGTVLGEPNIATPSMVASGPLETPSSPTQVSATAGYDFQGVRLEWNVVLGATEYEIWRSTENDSTTATKIGTVSNTTSFDDITDAGGVLFYYWIRAVNASGNSGFIEATSATSSSVQAPQILQQPSSQTITVSTSGAFTLTASGDPDPTYQWQIKLPGSEIWNDIGIDYSHSYLNPQTDTLAVVLAPRQYDGHQFRCVVTNRAGSIVSEVATLNVREAAAMTTTAGFAYSLFQHAEGLLWATGDNTNGQFAAHHTVNMSLSPVAATTAVRASVGAFHTLLLKSDQTLWSVGANSFGQLGLGHQTDESQSLRVTTEVIAVNAGVYHSLFLKLDGTLWGMGYNPNGQLGNGTTTDQSTPVQIDTDVADMSAGLVHSVYVKADGTAWATGDNANGQFSTGNTTGSTQPIQVATGIAAVDTGYYHTLFLKRDGTLWTAGSNAQGQLGDGTTTERTSMVEVAQNVIRIAATYNTSLFLKADGSLWGMGDNSSGQLATGDTANQSTPVQIASDVSSMSVGFFHVIFSKNDGTTWAVGQNTNGQLGDGTTTNRLTPVLISSGGYVPTTAPARLSATNSESATSVLLTWAPSAQEDHFEVWRNTVDEPETATLIASPLYTTVYEDTTGTAGVEYYYWIKAVNPLDSSWSDSAQGRYGIIVVSAPAITTQPQSQSVTLGEEATLTVTVTDTSPLSYQWQLDGSPISGATSGSYTIPSVTLAHAGDYTVIVSNSAGNVTSDPATLTLTGSPSIFRQPFDRSDFDGRVVTFSVVANGLPVLNYQWQKLSSGSSDWVNLSDASPYSETTTDDMRISAITYLMNGDRFRCVVSNEYGSVFSEAGNLNVMPSAPQIIVDPQNQTVLEDESVTFSVTVIGTEPYNYQWRKDGQDIVNANDASLTLIHTSQATDVGSYDVIVSSTFGSVTSNPASLQVITPPIVLRQPVGRSVHPGDSTIFTARIEYTGGTNTYQWMKDGVPIGDAAILSSDSTSYQVSNVQASDAGAYSVRATNAAGSVTSVSAPLTLLSSPPPSGFNQGGRIETTLQSPISLSAGTSSEWGSPVSYQWYFNGEPIPGANAAIYDISDPTPADLGEYFAAVTSPNGTGFTANRNVVPWRDMSPLSIHWIDVKKQGDVIYFLFKDTPRIVRYDLNTGWLPTWTLANTPTAFAIADDAIYVASASEVVRYDVDFTNPATLYTTEGVVTGLIVKGSHLFVGSDNYPHTEYRSILRTTGVLVDTKRITYGPKHGFSYDEGREILYAEGALTSHTDAWSIAYRSDGTFGDSTTSNYLGTNSPSAQTHLVANGSLLVRENGVVQRTSDLARTGSAGGYLNAIIENEDASYDVLRIGRVSHLNAAFQETGRANFSTPATFFARHGTDLIGFTQPTTTTALPFTETIATSTIQPLPPAAPLDPVGRKIWNPQVFADPSGIIYVYSKLDRQIYRWSASEARYLNSLTLATAPDMMAFSAENNALYFSRDDTQVRRQALTEPLATEQPFYSAALTLDGLQTAGQYVLASDHSGNNGRNYIVSPTGEPISHSVLGHFSRQYAWNEFSRKMYFYNDNSFPKDLRFEMIDSSGQITNWGDSPYHGEVTADLPIRVSPDGTAILLGSGEIYADSDLTRIGTLGAPVTDGTWQQGLLQTIRETPSGTEVESWSTNGYTLERRASISGIPMRILSILGDRLLVITSEVGVLKFTYLDPQNLNVIVPDPIEGFPQILEQPTSQNVMLGATVTFTVTAAGEAPLTYQWYQGDAQISGATGASHTISAAALNDTEPYRVYVSNSLGTVISTAVSLSVTKLNQSITFEALADRGFTSNPVTLTATSDSSLTVTYTVQSGPATISGDQLTMTGLGTVTVRASQAGNENYLVAANVDRSFEVTASAQSWLSTHFSEAEISDELISGANVDPDGDGLTNLLEYALGLDPRSTDTTGLPEMSTTATDWVYTYTRPVDRVDITYEVEMSTDLSGWTTSNVTHELVSTSGEIQTWRATVPLTSGDNVFFRLKIAQ